LFVESTAAHWDAVYGSKAPVEQSWFEADPAASLRLIEEWASPTSGVVDVGAGASTLVDRLLVDGFEDVTLVDVSRRVLEAVRERLGPAARAVKFVASDVLSWEPGRRFGVWHDRAVFHFLTDGADRDRYVAQASDAVSEEGVVVLATFADDGPEMCSGLPVCRYTPQQLREVFVAFDMMHAERVEHVTPWGVKQPFTYVVMRHRSMRTTSP